MKKTKTQQQTKKTATKTRPSKAKASQRPQRQGGDRGEQARQAQGHVSELGEGREHAQFAGDEAGQAARFSRRHPRPGLGRAELRQDHGLEAALAGPAGDSARLAPPPGGHGAPEA